MSELVGERSANTALLAATALALATAVGLPLGVFTASRRRGLIPRRARRPGRALGAAAPHLARARAAGGANRLAADRRISGPSGTSSSPRSRWPCRRWAPSRAPGGRAQRNAPRAVHGRRRRERVPDRSLLWRHAFRASLAPVLGVYAIIVASLFSGSFAVEIVTSWPGLGRLMFDALIARDIHLVAGCAVAGSAGRQPRGGCGPGLGRPENGRGVVTLGRGAGAILVALWIVAGIFAPFLSPNPPTMQFELPYAPPMRPHVIGADGGLHAPFVYPGMRIGNLLERRYEIDRSRRVSPSWFRDGRLATTTDPAAPLLILGADAIGRDVFARLPPRGPCLLGVALVACLLSLVAGTLIGAAAATRGPRR